MATVTAKINFVGTQADAQAAMDEYIEYLHDSGGDETIEFEIEQGTNLTVTSMTTETDGYTFNVTSPPSP